MRAIRANGTGEGPAKTQRWPAVDVPTVFKVIAAFLAGFVIVMGGALMHSRAPGFGQPVHAKSAVVPPVATSMPARSEQHPTQTAAEARPSDLQTVDSPVIPADTPKRSPALVEDAGTRLPYSGRITSPQTQGPKPPEMMLAASNRLAVASAQQSASAARPRVIPPAEHAPAQSASVPAPQYAATAPLYVPDVPAVLPEHDAVSQPAAPEAIPDQAKTKSITVQAGTPIAVRLAETLATDRNRTGDTFRAALAAPLVVNGYVVAESGAAVLGRVINAHKAPLVGGRAVLTLELTNLETRADGMIRVGTSTWEEKGTGSNIVNTAKMATGAAVGAVVGAVAGAAEGAGLISGVQERDRTDGFMATKRTVVLPAGRSIAFTIATPLAVTERLDSN